MSQAGCHFRQGDSCEHWEGALGKGPCLAGLQVLEWGWGKRGADRTQAACTCWGEQEEEVLG